VTQVGPTDENVASWPQNEIYNPGELRLKNVFFVKILTKKRSSTYCKRGISK